METYAFDGNKKMLPLDTIKNEQINMILRHFGEEHQRIKACEELAELQVEVFHNDSSDCLEATAVYDNLVFEIADVYIMLEQLVKIYNLKKQDIDKAMTLKLRRTEDKVRAEVKNHED
jgi:hypothetical protein